jgi:glycosyltransferase involved in cell wall biosynthesis
MSAFAFGVPVIATNVGGLPEMVEHLKTGVIIPARDSQAIADNIVLLLNNPKLQLQISSNIYQKYVQGEMSWSSIVNNLRTNIYSSTLK